MKSTIPQMVYKCPIKTSDLKNTSKGKFCDKCSKHIPDMRGKPNDEILNEIERHKGEYCGTFDSIAVKNPFGDRRDKVVHWYQGLKNSGRSNWSVFMLLGLFIITLTGCWTRRRGYVSYHNHAKRFPTTMNSQK